MTFINLHAFELGTIIDSIALIFIILVVTINQP